MTTNPIASAAQCSVTSNERSPAKRSRAPYRQQLTAGGPGKTPAGSEARRLAAVILEVLAGVQTPTSAAQALGIRLPRYYFIEQRALGGLVSACEPRSKGRTVSSDRQIARLERELVVCRRELGRQQALARAAQRVLGLKVAAVPAVATPHGKSATAGKKSRKRRPVVRALRAARVLRADSSISAAAGKIQVPSADAPLAGGENRLAGTDAESLQMQGEQGG